jgi:hypothetical protein
MAEDTRIQCKLSPKRAEIEENRSIKFGDANHPRLTAAHQKDADKRQFTTSQFIFMKVQGDFIPATWTTR